MSAEFRLGFLAVAWVAWMLPFLIFRPKNRPKAVDVRRKARWGIALVAAGFWLTFLHSPATWRSEFPVWRFVLAALFAAVGSVTAAGAIRALGRQWRFDAGLNADHELVKNGPYRVVRHPIYASMLCMILAGIAAIGTWPTWPFALVLFVAGTEIRVRTEDALLRGRFAGEFDSWRRAVPAYVPFVR